LVTIEQIEASATFIDPDGLLWAVPHDGGPHQLIATPKGIDPAWLNVMRCAPMMLRTLLTANVGFDKVIAYAEACDDQALANNVLRLQAAVTTTIRCAIEGLDVVARNSEKRD
jgi:hypothetical protein